MNDTEAGASAHLNAPVVGEDGVTVEDITTLIQQYFQPGSTVTMSEITNLVNQYLNQK